MILYINNASYFYSQLSVGLETNNAAFLEDAAQNADLYIAYQDVTAQT